VTAGPGPGPSPGQRPPRFPDGSITDPAQCLICQLEDADDDAVVFRDGIWACEVAPGFEVPGWFFLRVRRHALGWRELKEAELSTFGEHARDLMAALEVTFTGPARYLMTFGEAYPHFHCVVTTRGDDVPPEFRSGNILRLRDTRLDRAEALRRVPAVRAAYAALAHSPPAHSPPAHSPLAHPPKGDDDAE
jgi:diadenosine tetraphosphate (Ap4A) HIT family hydrolase